MSRRNRTNIPDGTNITVTTSRRGEQIRVDKGDRVEVDGAPAVVLDDDRSSLRNEGTIATTGDTETVRVDADRVAVKNTSHGAIEAEDTAVEITGERAFVANDGRLEGDVNGVNFVNGGESSGTLVNRGVIESDSRAVNIGGENILVVNQGDIIGTGDQRNGTIYSDASAERYAIVNDHGATIDAGEGNQGAGIALQTGDEDGESVRASIVNRGEIDGRGQAASNVGLAGDGIRIFSGTPGGEDESFRGNLVNSGRISSESNQGTTAGVRVADGVGFDGTIANQHGGVIEGANNGLYFGNAEHDARVLNDGTIQSDSRAVNIDGTGVDLVNRGEILGTGNQRNGTIYSDATADDYSIVNERHATVDAGEGNQGAGIALQTGDVDGDTVEASIVNRGEIDGRGQAASNVGLAGDGVRIFSGTPGGENETFEGHLVNSGRISSESNQGTTAGVRVADGVGFDGTIANQRGGLIEGANNGLYFGNAEHDARVVNDGTIQSDSRAVNIDGTGVDLVNRGDILGTDNQRNGTIYSDATADDYSIRNERRGDVDAGEGNQGAGIALQTGDVDGDTVHAQIVNRGEIDGRGQGAADSGLAGDGIRIFSGTPGGEDETFEGYLINSGRISSESTQGPTSGVRIANGVGFDGTIANRRGGLIEGANNGLYFGDAAHDARVINDGTIRSDSRAVNIDGSGVELVNRGDIVGTGNQRNGTIYSDATAEDYQVVNERRGLVDAGHGNDGAGISLQTGDENGDIVSASVRNSGRIVGRGDGEGNLEGDGVRIFSGASEAPDGVIFQGDLENYRDILGSDDAIDIRAGVTLDGDIVNTGRLVGDDTGIEITGAVDGVIRNHGIIAGGRAAIDASEAEAGVEVLNRGRIDGDALLSAFDDVFVNDGFGRIHGDVLGGAGDDRIEGGRFGDRLFGGAGNDELRGGGGDDFLQGGGGSDLTDGGSGNDTASFADIGSSVTADLSEGEASYAAPNGNTVTDQLVSIENLVGSSNADSLAGDEGNNVLTGGDGEDTFVFRANAGRDVVTDFEEGDRLDVSDLFDSAEDALTAARQVGANTVVDLGSGDRVTLVGVQADDLDADVFLV
ncbi:MAG: calcium-binding protein [Myxococcota bacterium]